jgi:hypothetical protein
MERLHNTDDNNTCQNQYESIGMKLNLGWYRAVSARSTKILSRTSKDKEASNILRLLLGSLCPHLEDPVQVNTVETSKILRHLPGSLCLLQKDFVQVLSGYGGQQSDEIITWQPLPAPRGSCLGQHRRYEDQQNIEAFTWQPLLVPRGFCPGPQRIVRRPAM